MSVDRIKTVSPLAGASNLPKTQGRRQMTAILEQPEDVRFVELNAGQADVADEPISDPAAADSIRRKIREDQRRKRLAEHRRASSLNSSLREPGVSERVLAKLKAAEAARDIVGRLSAHGAERNRAQIGGQLARVRRLEMEAAALARQEEDARWLSDAMAETVGLAAERGEEVESETVEMVTYARGEHGEQLFHRTGAKKGQPVMLVERVHRAVIRTGLGHALEKGHLQGGQGAPRGEALYAAGCMYGAAFEISVGRIASSGERGGGFGPKGPQVRIVEAGDRLQIMRRGLSARELRVLDLVCGEGLRARQVATAMSAGFPATVRALRSGLRTAMDNWAEAQKVRATGGAAQRIQRAAEIVGRVKI